MSNFSSSATVGDSFFTNFPARSMSVTDIEATYLAAIELTLGGVLHGVEFLLSHSGGLI